MTRNTHHKQSVLNALRLLHGRHPTADHVYELVSKDILSLSKATVYRILRQFSERGIVARLHIPGSADRYDDVTSPHYHLVCDACGKVIDLPVRFEKTLLPKTDVSGCEITGVELVFRGFCPECATSGKRV